MEQNSKNQGGQGGAAEPINKTQREFVAAQKTVVFFLSIISIVLLFSFPRFFRIGGITMKGFNVLDDKKKI